jgi:hypothetical protein
MVNLWVLDLPMVEEEVQFILKIPLDKYVFKYVSVSEGFQFVSVSVSRHDWDAVRDPPNLMYRRLSTSLKACGNLIWLSGENLELRPSYT